MSFVPAAIQWFFFFHKKLGVDCIGEECHCSREVQWTFSCLRRLRMEQRHTTFVSFRHESRSRCPLLSHQQLTPFPSEQSTQQQSSSPSSEPSALPKHHHHHHQQQQIVARTKPNGRHTQTVTKTSFVQTYIIVSAFRSGHKADNSVPISSVGRASDF